MGLIGRFAALPLALAGVLAFLPAAAAERGPADAVSALAIPEGAIAGHLISKNDNDDRREWRRGDDRRDWRREHRGDRREWRKDRREADREYRKDRREAKREWRKDRREAEREWRKDRQEARRDWDKDRRRWEKHGRDDWRDERRAYREGYWDATREARYRYRNRHGYRVGHYVRRPHYVVVEDYYDYGWRRPPAGYGYMNVGGDIFLVALATGLIVSALNQ